MSFLKKHQQQIAIAAGYLLIAGLFFGLGRFSGQRQGPAVRVEEPALDLTQIYNNLNSAQPQTAPNQQGSVSGAGTSLDCQGKIKGNISSSAKIYHMPGGAFYKRTNPEMCFNTEAEAQAAGFRKSQR